MAAADAAPGWPRPLVRAVAEFDPSLTVLTSASPAIEGAAAASGLHVGALLSGRPRLHGGRATGARASCPAPSSTTRLPCSPACDACWRRATVETYDGTVIGMPCTSILLHGDTTGALDLARAVRRAVAEAGGGPVPLSRQGPAIALAYRPHTRIVLAHGMAGRRIRDHTTAEQDADDADLRL